MSYKLFFLKIFLRKRIKEFIKMGCGYWACRKVLEIDMEEALDEFKWEEQKESK